MVPTDVFTELAEGNRRFADGRPHRRDLEADRAATADVHRPKAVVVSCSDARVPVEAVFDQPAGALFVVRSAGHVPGDVGLASVRFAVEVLGVRAVLVMGHEDCGAVRAALTGTAPEWLSPIAAGLDLGGESDMDAAVAANVHAGVARLRAFAANLGLPEDRLPKVGGTVYCLRTGLVEWIDEGEQDG